MIVITQSELECIKKIGKLTTERIMYVLLVLAKHYQTDTFYVTKKDLRRYSKCHLNSNAFDNEIFKLNQISYVTPNLCGSVTVNILNDKSDAALEVNELEEMIHVYLDTCKIEGYIFCSKCGKKIPQKINNQIFCERCSIVQRRETNKKSLKKARKKKVCTSDHLQSA